MLHADIAETVKQRVRMSHHGLVDRPITGIHDGPGPVIPQGILVRSSAFHSATKFRVRAGTALA